MLGAQRWSPDHSRAAAGWSELAGRVPQDGDRALTADVSDGRARHSVALRRDVRAGGSLALCLAEPRVTWALDATTSGGVMTTHGWSRRVASGDIVARSGPPPVMRPRSLSDTVTSDSRPKIGSKRSVDRCHRYPCPPEERHAVICHLLRAAFRLTSRNPVVRERHRLAQGLDALPRGARRPQLTTPSLIDPTVAEACGPSAARIAEILRDARADIDAASLSAIRQFLTDGCSSPLYRSDASDAFVAIASLEMALTNGRIRSMP